MSNLENDIKYLKGVGEHRSKLLHKLNIFTIRDLMEHFPRDYINRRSAYKIRDLKLDQNCSFVGIIVSVEKKQFSRKKNQLNVVLTDGEDYLFLTWFRFGNWFLNQFENGKQIWVSGVISEFRGSPQIVHPQIEVLDDEELKLSFWKTRSVLPVYHLTEGITINVMRKLVYNAFKLYADDISENLPQYILEKFTFTDRKTAMQKLHFTQHPADIHKDKIRFIFEELFFIQLMLARCKYGHEKKLNGNQFILKKTFTTKLKHSLPFQLTNAQKRVIREFVEDMTSKKQMNRLLQGDVGSGKTIVTVFAMLLAIENGFQSLMMTPTEILAEQHYRSISNLLSNQPEIKIALLKGGNSKYKRELKEKIRKGEINIIIGTHALIQKDVEFKNAGFLAIDEQHRFGVQQRSVLSHRNNNPDLIYLSATPIPRSLALTVYGDLDVSIIDELPPNRKKIETSYYNANKNSVVYDKVDEQLNLGRQAYIVCPLIQESEKIDLLDAESLYEKLKKHIFPSRKIALLHGKMKNNEKDKIMENFKNGQIDILVSTTVIEVGIDVPNACVMIIQHAERFGLSQLHQLRGRVGRGSDMSYCYLIVYPPISEEGRERLNIMIESNDGFKIAEKDLEIRGQGDFFGTQQSGIPIFKHANIIRDRQLLNTARILAFDLIEADYKLELEKNNILNKVYFKEYFEREKLFDF
ncbi:MAG: ATP-dependent DNA helicase RecG [Candidatus Cloacimonetes bacterium]|nr:ATP-dependent DNA helicase RecG [Candidatus Cloacimonadota bacterium]